MNNTTVDGLWLLSLTEKTYWDELEKFPNTFLTVKCTDGDAKVHRRMLQWAWPILEFIITYNVHLSKDLLPNEDDIPTAGTYEDLLSINLKYTYAQLKGAIPLVRIGELGVNISRVMANASRRIEEYSSALDAEDYHDLIYAETIASARNKVVKLAADKCTPQVISAEIKASYQTLKDYVKYDGLINHHDNGVVHLMVSETCKPVQLNQGVMVVGYTSDVNSDFFPMPVVSNYAIGLNSVFSFAANAASGAKSLMYSHTPMQDTEYLHRLVQQISSCFNEVIYGDCGSDVTVRILVTDANSHSLIGKYHVVSEKLNEVTDNNHKELVGTTINARVVTGCLVPDKGAVCTACGGAVTMALRKWASVGWSFTTRTFSPVSQAVLGVKHSDMTSISDVVELSRGVVDHLIASDDNAGLRFDKAGYQLGFKVKNGVVRIDEVLSMSDAEFNNINPWDFLSVFDVIINHEDGVTINFEGQVLERKDEITLSVNLLRWIRLNPKVVTYEYLARKQLACWIDLTEYPHTEKVFITKFAHYDMLKLFSAVETFIKGRTKTQSGGNNHITEYINFNQAVTRFWELYSSKIPINRCVLELAMYAFTVTDPSSDDWSPYRGDGDCYFAPMMSIFEHRSLSTMLGSESIHEVLATPQASTVTNRVASHYDPFFMM
jgi:hypothetical protein